MPSMPNTFRHSRLPSRQEKRREYDRKRDVLEWRSWYKTERWKKLKIAVHVRDGYICQQTGELLTGKFPADNSPVADHRTRHHGNPDLFWDINNVQTVSKAYHDSQKQRLERANP